MNPECLPIVGPITNTEKDFYGKFTDLHDKKILCIGFSELEIEEYVLKYGPKMISTLTKWPNHVDAKVTKFDLVIGDITERTGFQDHAFDAILTLSLLEHLSDVHGAFDEMTRITRPGGEMLHMFGPAWSCAYGHHCYDTPEEPLLNFSLWRMPAHMHLLCTREEIMDYYQHMGLSEGAAMTAIHWFFETDVINRVVYDEYMSIFMQERYQIDKLELMYNALPYDHLKRLRKAYPEVHDFSTYGGKYKLVINK